MESKSFPLSHEKVLGVCSNIFHLSQEICLQMCGNILLWLQCKEFERIFNEIKHFYYMIDAATL